MKLWSLSHIKAEIDTILCDLIKRSESYQSVPTSNVAVSPHNFLALEVDQADRCIDTPTR